MGLTLHIELQVICPFKIMQTIRRKQDNLKTKGYNSDQWIFWYTFKKSFNPVFEYHVDAALCLSIGTLWFHQLSCMSWLWHIYTCFLSFKFCRRHLLLHKLTTGALWVKLPFHHDNITKQNFTNHNLHRLGFRYHQVHQPSAQLEDLKYAITTALNTAVRVQNVTLKYILAPSWKKNRNQRFRRTGGMYRLRACCLAFAIL